MITFTRDDIFKQDVEALVNPVNCVGVMGKGLALEFKRRYPVMFDAYKSACESGGFYASQMFVYHTGEMFGVKYIVNFPTKKHWRDQSEYQFIENGLISLYNEIERLEIQSIAIPSLGCGLGGLDWNVVKPMIRDRLQDLDCEIIVLEPR